MPPAKKAGTAASTTTNLLHLLPNYTASTLPKQIVDLGVSLYNTSKARAELLKKDEEIAREYACCVLAVERLKKPLNLPVDKLEPRPPVPPRVFERLLRFLDKALPDPNATPAKKRGRPPGSSKDPAKRAHPEESQIDPALRPEGSDAPRSRKSSKRAPPPNSLTENLDAPSSPGVPRWTSKFLSRYRVKLQERMSEHAWNRILHDESFLQSVVSTGVSAVRGSKGDTDAGVTAVPRDDGSAVVVAVLTVVLLWHLGPSALDVSQFTKDTAHELASGGVVKTTAFGAVVGDARDLVQEKRDEWQQTPWCLGELAESQKKRRISGAPGSHEASDGGEQGAEPSRSKSDDEAAEDTGPTEVLRSRAGPMAQAQPDLQSPARKRDYKQWKTRTSKRAAAMQQQQEAA